MSSFRNESRFRPTHAWLNQELSEHSIAHVNHKKKCQRPSSAGGHGSSSRVVAQAEKPYQTADLLKGFKRMGLNLSTKQIKRLEGVSGKSALESILDFSKALQPGQVDDTHAAPLSENNGRVPSFKTKKNDSTQAQQIINQALGGAECDVEKRPVSPSRVKKKEHLRGKQVRDHLRDDSGNADHTKPLSHDVNRARYALDKKFHGFSKHDFSKLFKVIRASKQSSVGLNTFKSLLTDSGLQMSPKDARLLFASQSNDKVGPEKIDLKSFANFARQAWQNEGHKVRLTESEIAQASLKRVMRDSLQECYPFPQEAYEEIKTKYGGLCKDAIVNKFLPSIGVTLGEQDRQKMKDLLQEDPDGKVPYQAFVNAMYTDTSASPSLNKSKPKAQRQFRRGSQGGNLRVSTGLSPDNPNLCKSPHVQRNLSASIDHINELWREGPVSPRITSPVHRNLHASVDHVDLSWGGKVSPTRRRPHRRRANTDGTRTDIQSLLQPEAAASRPEDNDHLTSALGKGQQRRKYSQAHLETRMKQLIECQARYVESNVKHERAKPRSTPAARMSLGKRVSTILHPDNGLDTNSNKVPQKSASAAPPPPGLTFGRPSDFERTARKRLLGTKSNESGIFTNPQYPSNIVQERSRVSTPRFR